MGVRPWASAVALGATGPGPMDVLGVRPKDVGVAPSFASALACPGSGTTLAREVKVAFTLWAG